MNISKISTTIGIVILGVSAICIYLFADIDYQAKIAILVMMLAVILWVTDWMPGVGTGFLCIILLVACGGVNSLSEGVIGFSKPICYFLIGILAIGYAVKRSGLADRVANYIIGLSLGNPVLLYFQMLGSFVVLTFFLPSATTRGAIIVNMYEEVLDTWNVPKSHPFHKMLMLAMLALNRCASTALLAGGITPVVASGLMGDFSWIEWFVIMSIPFYANLFVGGIIIYVWYRKGAKSVQMMPYKLPPAKPITIAEIKTIVIIFITVSLWFTDFIHGLHAAVPAVLALVLIMFPKIGVLTWEDLQEGIAWSNFFITATALSLGLSLLNSGGADWLGSNMVDWGLKITNNATLLIIMMMILVGLARIAFNNISSYLAIMIPITMGFSDILGVSPLLAGFLTVVVGDSLIFYCAGTGSGLIIFERSGLSNAEVFRFACVMLVAVVIIANILVLPYWKLIGFQ
ncbi:MAG TPA: hypothetical protein DEZ08_07545 [Dehalococcoidia bacterium]|jgi:sodium-dependent dicarboxylate transporter 2/3/5|nr:hypothetical protein [Dehalococcoidia bacterium]|tara:strand:- start:1101 stop:2477 length:1377 start_codon:yes stop_codon:yes gene_type:complete